MTAAGQNNSEISSVMLPRKRRSDSSRRRSHARAFAALGDETRLMLVRTLSSGQPHSISQLTAGTALTRQAVTKHLRVLEEAGIVRGVRSGRESIFEFNQAPIETPRKYLVVVSGKWDQAFGRL